MDKEYKDEQIGDLDGEEGVDPLAFGEEQENGEAGKDGEEEDDRDYGELSDGDESQMKSHSQMPSNLDRLEQKQELDKVMINEATNEFIQDKKLWFRGLHKEHGDGILEKAIE